MPMQGIVSGAFRAGLVAFDVRIVVVFGLGFTLSESGLLMSMVSAIPFSTVAANGGNLMHDDW